MCGWPSAVLIRPLTVAGMLTAPGASFADSMAKRLGKKVSISTDIDDSLIAGAVITAGDLVIDGSASGRIEKLSLAVNK